MYISKFQLNDQIVDKLKEITQLQNNLKLYDLEYTALIGKHCNLTRYSLAIVFLRDMHEENLSLEDTNEEQSHLVNDSQYMGKM